MALHGCDSNKKGCIGHGPDGSWVCLDLDLTYPWLPSSVADSTVHSIEFRSPILIFKKLVRGGGGGGGGV